MATSLCAQKLDSGPQVLSFFSDIDDTEQPYGLYLPENYDPGKKYPLVVMLHGAGSNHRLALRRVFGKTNQNGETDVEASRYFPRWENREYLVASPNARGTMGYQGIAEKDVLDMVEDVKRRFSVDENRMYLTGLSMGGGGTLWIGLAYPDMWAAMAPVCPAPPAEAAALAANAFNIPVHIHQGGADPVVRPEGVRAWVESLKSKGVAVEYSEYPGVGHDSWANAYQDGAIFDWFGQFERNPFPERVKYEATQYKHNKAYWITLDAFTPGTLTGIDAQFTGENQLVVRTTNLRAFTLRLAGHPFYKSEKPLKVNIDGKVVEAAADKAISFLKTAERWENKPYYPPALVKRKGIEGPMIEVVSTRHIYVYGTGGNPSEEEMARRREQAGKAAEWSGYRGEFLGRIMVFPRILSDREVRLSDLQGANLILFGDKTTNSIIEQYSGRLPLHLNDPSGDYGLAYVFPVGN
ncbi:MAG: dienelactone hydrolase family protein, partial [Phaeodactylibacter sp.]|nr:dienelactone hydrolase family protein [Phaeodactylibacter sp.]